MMVFNRVTSRFWIRIAYRLLQKDVVLIDSENSGYVQLRNKNNV